MTQITVFTTTEITSSISTSKIFVFTFYLNGGSLWRKLDYCTVRKDIVLLQCK